MQLTDIATITSGHLFRKRLQPKPEGKYQVVQVKDIDRFSRLESKRLFSVDLDSVGQDYRLSQGDILFRSRGKEHLATVIEEPLENTIAVSHFFILRVHREDVLPGYLAWYINQVPAQKQISLRAAGTRIQHINKKSLGEVEIIIPPVDIQKTIVELHRLSIRETELMDALKEKRLSFIDSMSLKAVHRSE